MCRPCMFLVPFFLCLLPVIEPPPAAAQCRVRLFSRLFSRPILPVDPAPDEDGAPDFDPWGQVFDGKGDWKTNGVEPQKIWGDKDRYFLSGKPITHATVIEAIQAGTLPKDDAWPHLTIIAREYKTGQEIAGELGKEPEMAAWLKSLRVQVYDPGNKVHREMLKSWNLDEDPEFQKTGVMIAFQPAAGKDGQAPVQALFDRVKARAVKTWLDRVAGKPRVVPDLKVDVSHALTIPPALYVLGGAGLVGAAGFLRRTR